MIESQQTIDPSSIKVEEKVKTFKIHHFFRFADKIDILMMVLGVFGSLGAGCGTPLSLYIGVFMNDAVVQPTKDTMKSEGFDNMMYAIYLGIASLVTGCLMITMWVITGQRQSSRCKKEYYESLIKQDTQFFDQSEQSSFNSQFTLDTGYYQSAIGEKIAALLQIIGSILCSLIISLWKGWFMAAIIIVSLFLIIVLTIVNLSVLKNKENNFLEIYRKAGGRAEEAINAIKTVKQFNAQKFESDEYSNCLDSTSNNKCCSITKIAVSFGLLNSAIYLMYALGFWIGAQCLSGSNVCLVGILGSNYVSSDTLTIFFTLSVCCLEITLIVPAIKHISFGFEAAKRIFAVIDRVPNIRLDEDGIKLDEFQGKVQFRNVTFAYPRHKNNRILNGLNIKFDLNSSSALVGESGCGKSTIAQLLMRYYDPEEGEIFIDGHNIREINLLWLRSKIGYVGQEPVLFAATIKENLQIANPQATEEDIKCALKQAQVYDFIYQHLEKSIDTYVGVGGSQISGGQKQRIAIARALIKKPKILILDEATSALDPTNEKLIQDTLNKISKTLVTITIAHRIGTIKSCDNIFVLGEGVVKENGKYEELQYFKNKENDQTGSNKSVNKSEEYLPETKSQLGSQMNEQQIQINADNNSSSRPFEKKQENGSKVETYEQKNKVPHSISIEANFKLYSRIFSFNKTKKCQYVIAIILAICTGTLFPIFGIFAADAVNSQTFYMQDLKDSYMSAVYSQCQKFVITSLVAFICNYLQSFFGEMAGEEVASNIRKDTFSKILKMPVAWFDKKDNTCGAISSKLSLSCEKIKELITTYFFLIIRSVSAFICAFLIAFLYQWKLTLVIIGLAIASILAGLLRNHFKSKLTKELQNVHKNTSGMIQESLMNTRTINAFNMQKSLIERYKRQLQHPSKSLPKIGFIAGIMNGIGLFILYSLWGILPYVSILLIIYDGARFIDLISAIFPFYFMSISLNKNMSVLPNTEETKLAASNIFNILDSQDEQQLQEAQQSLMLQQEVKFNVQFRNVSFKYEGRDKWILKDFNLKIRQGEKVALVGSSGCGKSTVMQLLLRFYEPTQGNILINGISLKDFDLKHLRRQYGVVGQQPTVFNASFRENIQYNAELASQEDIREAARKANALGFIEDRDSSDRGGFYRVVGAKGLHISGGQKQRVAIARVVLRNPKVLLLDQATSALDAENQKFVQQSLDSIMKARTIITVAHRIETIKNSDIIYVVEKGSVIQQGTYIQLVKANGTFCQMEKGIN